MTEPAAIQTAGLNQTLLQLFKRLTAGSAPNTVFSPFSLAVILAVLAAGARNRTRDELRSWLRLGSDPERTMHGLLEQLRSNGDCLLRLANALWVREDQPLLPGAQEDLRRLFEAGLFRADFSLAKEVADAINDFVRKQTEGKITDLASPDMIGPDSRLIAVNTLYFNGSWQEPFESDDTETGTFHLADGTTREIPMMFQCEYFHYISVPDPAVHGVVLPYKGGDCELIALMTRSEKDPVEKAIAALNAGALNDWIEKAETETVRLTLPRLTLESELMELKEPLQEAGMDSLFTDGADLSGFSGRRDLKADRIIQKVRLEISERGTEAAAATEVLVRVLGLPAWMRKNNKILDFTVDRPFLLLVRHRTTGLLLFAAAVRDPGAGED
ncbi:MAG: serpin family protein [Lentisphaeria bacterium]|nr:serpin family protein [Lentisphaeria bacterium]